MNKPFPNYTYAAVDITAAATFPKNNDSST